MPSVIGSFQIVTNSGTVNNGDSLITAPTLSSKSNSGAGSGVTGDFSATMSFFSATITNDPNRINSGSRRATKKWTKNER